MHGSTVRNLLVRGMIAGLLAGLFAFALAYLAGEPSVRASIAQEEARSAPAHQEVSEGQESSAAHAHGDEEEEEELVSRPVQSTFGLATGVLVYGVAVGGIASLVFAVGLGRIGRFGPRATATMIAGAAFVTVFLVPFLKYPAAPPAVGSPDTIGRRTALYFLMILLSVLVALIAVIAGKRLAPRIGNWNASLVAGAGYVVVIALACLVLPSNTDAVPESFPAALLWEFRLASIAVQAVLWTAFGVIFGVLAERLLQQGKPGAEPSGTASEASSQAPSEAPSEAPS
ncbi:CbtA family protein [Streptomyces sp. NPDC087658]|uniref:CbtA family protein n=1 Tax=Streptomyces sp. NPDC087658 TaxID=3365800 RepID=UPI0038074725